MSKLREIFDKYFISICVGILIALGGAIADYVKNFYTIPDRLHVLEQRLRTNDSLDQQQKFFLESDFKELQKLDPTFK